MKKILSAAVLILLIAAISLFSQTGGKGKMRGIVCEAETGQPIPGVTVRLYCEALDAYYLPFPVTDKDGKWGAYYLRTGMWSLDFEKVGYEPQKLSYRVGFAVGGPQELIEIKLRKIQNLVVKETILSKLQSADKLFAQKKYGEAQTVYETLLAENPDLYVLNKNIGNCYFAVENYEKALVHYLKVQEKQADRADVLTAIANSYNNWGKMEQAVEWYKKIPLAGIRDIDTAYNAGVLLLNAGSAEEALPYFQKSVEIDVEFADGFYRLGMALVALNRSEEALAALRKFLDLAPDSPDATVAKSVIDALSKK
jgi:tetratricopeptide (TPR) repeat protein